MIYDNTAGEPISVEGSQDEKGLAKIEATFVAKSLAEAWSVAPGEFSNLKRAGLQLRKLGGGGYTVVGSYVGTSPSGDAAGAKVDLGKTATYELDFTQAQKPIQVHPNFATAKTGLKDVYKWDKLDKDNSSYGFQEKCPDGVTPAVGEKDKALNPLFGVTDWLDVGAIWRKSWMSEESEIPDTLFHNLGRIDIPQGPVPQVNQGRNWLRAAVKARGRGRAWELSIDWMLSGRGGHEPAIYKSFI